MGSRTWAALAVVFIGVLAVAGCNRQPEEVPPVTYDLSPESNAEFLSDNAAKEGVITTPTGLQYRVIQAGDGPGLGAPEDVVTVTYKGWLIDGSVFDETAPGDTAEFPADGLISGWVEALSMMKVGDEWELVIPSELGYGAFGAGNVIPPDQTLVFNMKLLEVQPSQPQP